uniref:RELT like 2 n=1 Tax=Terrapene triunguis TaxID=2587831 RepID=A0A674JHJ1_9SAUR
MSEQNSTSDGDADPHHSMSMLLLLVLVFFIMGLVGFLICHVLKKKGYRCRTFRDELDLEHKEEELNEDTVEKIVRCIIQNEVAPPSCVAGTRMGACHITTQCTLAPHRHHAFTAARGRGPHCTAKADPRTAKARCTLERPRSSPWAGTW